MPHPQDENNHLKFFFKLTLFFILLDNLKSQLIITSKIIVFYKILNETKITMQLNNKQNS